MLHLPEEIAMKPLSLGASCLLVLVVVAGCASTEITQHESSQSEKLA
jgi:hypothetical protein